MSHSVPSEEDLVADSIEDITHLGLSVIGVHGISQPITKRGDVLLEKDRQIGVMENFRMKNVLVIPKSKNILISVSKLLLHGFKVSFDDNKATIRQKAVVVVEAKEHKKLFQITKRTEEQTLVRS